MPTFRHQGRGHQASAGQRHGGGPGLSGSAATEAKESSPSRAAGARQGARGGGTTSRAGPRPTAPRRPCGQAAVPERRPRPAPRTPGPGLRPGNGSGAQAGDGGRPEGALDQAFRGKEGGGPRGERQRLAARSPRGRPARGRRPRSRSRAPSAAARGGQRAHSPSKLSPFDAAQLLTEASAAKARASSLERELEAQREAAERLEADKRTAEASWRPRGPRLPRLGSAWRPSAAGSTRPCLRSRASPQPSARRGTQGNRPPRTSASSRTGPGPPRRRSTRPTIASGRTSRPRGCGARSSRAGRRPSSSGWRAPGTRATASRGS